ncbi:helix-turn-helix transcriptional regulator [Gehongia tenuis]|uniref:Helix-turn-helix transcriptional regulator n=1 Tax=Gehongia tenuis TaxID=2763655 RepID=A0A926HRC2_9FIRM|nr:helix-turn-helix transcriptional regulator [Gehongia tenuis]MBC8532161.1 helix-turn-helix transcriptional regulator [Gehongia tenuis]
MVGAAIKAYLDNEGIKYSALAKRTEMPLNTLSAMLNCKRKMTAEEYFRICSALGVDAGYFVDKDF